MYRIKCGLFTAACAAGVALSMTSCVNYDEPTGTVQALSLGALEVAQTPVAADGTARVRVAVSVEGNTSHMPQVVRFATTAGEFDRVGGGDSSVVQVFSDAHGIAAAYLRAPSTPGTARITAQLDESIRQDSVKFVAVPLQPVMPGLTAFVATPQSAAADGATVITLDATVPDSATGDRRRVTFTTTAGTFIGSATPGSVAVDADVNGRAIALLRAPTDSGTTIVRASAGGTVLQNDLLFVEALADRIDIEANTYGIAAALGAKITITAFLQRRVGTVSKSVFPEFRAQRLDGSTIGQFGAPRTTTAGQVNIDFVLSDADYRGPIVFTGRVPGSTGPIEDTVTVFVLAPPAGA